MKSQPAKKTSIIVDIPTLRRAEKILNHVKVRMNFEPKAEFEAPGDDGVVMVMSLLFLNKKISLPIHGEFEDEDGTIVIPESPDSIAEQACTAIEGIIQSGVSPAHLKLINDVISRSNAAPQAALAPPAIQPGAPYVATPQPITKEGVTIKMNI